MIKYEVIQKFSKIHPNKPALIHDDRIISWGEFGEQTLHLIDRVNRISNFDASSPCLFISKNSTDIVLLGAALSSMCIPFQGVDYHLDVNIIKSIVKELNVKYVFVAGEFLEKFADLGEICYIYQIEELVECAKISYNVLSYSIVPAPQSPFQSYAFTSGTTGVPKIVYRTKSFDKQRFEYLINRYKFNNNDTHLVCLPMYHVSSTGWLRLFLNLGCAVVIHNFKDSNQLCELIHSKCVSTTIMSPYILKQMVAKLDENSGLNFFPFLRFIITGGKIARPISNKRPFVN